MGDPFYLGSKNTNIDTIFYSAVAHPNQSGLQVHAKMDFKVTFTSGHYAHKQFMHIKYVRMKCVKLAQCSAHVRTVVCLSCAVVRISMWLCNRSTFGMFMIQFAHSGMSVGDAETNHWTSGHRALKQFMYISSYYIKLAQWSVHMRTVVCLICPVVRVSMWLSYRPTFGVFMIWFAMDI